MFERSTEIDLIAAALVAAQAEMPIVHKDAVNPHFRSKYASFAAIRATEQPVLAKHGLALVQFPISRGEQVGLSTTILHKSGQFISDEVLLAANGINAQQFGSLTTYLKRYCGEGPLGVASDEDDDGNKAATPPPGNQQQTAPEVSSKASPFKDYRVPTSQVFAPAPATPNSWEPKFRRPTGDKANELLIDGVKKFWWVLIKQCGWDKVEAKELMVNMFGHDDLDQMTKGQFWDFEFLLRTKFRDEILAEMREFDASLAEMREFDAPPRNDAPDISQVEIPF